MIWKDTQTEVVIESGSIKEMWARESAGTRYQPFPVPREVWKCGRKIDSLKKRDSQTAPSSWEGGKQVTCHGAGQFSRFTPIGASLLIASCCIQVIDFASPSRSGRRNELLLDCSIPLQTSCLFLPEVFDPATAVESIVIDPHRQALFVLPEFLQGELLVENAANRKGAEPLAMRRSTIFQGMTISPLSNSPH
jgi:hypothetical protein